MGINLKPTLLPNHVAPSKRKHADLHLLAGALLGFGTVLVIDKEKIFGHYSINDLEVMTKMAKTAIKKFFF